MRKKRSEARERIKKLLGRVLTLLAGLVALVVFYLAVIIGQPAQDVMLADKPSPAAQTLLSAQLPVKVTLEEDIPSLLDSFPAPLMRLMPVQGLSFLEGKTYDIAYGGAFARAAELSYQLPEGDVLTLLSVYPRDAFTLVQTSGFTLNPTVGYTMLHLPAVRMDSADLTRLHTQGEEALYALTLPRTLAKDAASYLKLTQAEIPLP